MVTWPRTWSAWTGSIPTATCRIFRSVVSFMTAHLGYPIPSPAIMEKIGTAFRRSVRLYLEDNHIPVVRFHKGDRKIEVMGR
jgi:hypothetical protein